MDNLLEDLFTAYFDARKNKRNTINALAFELNYESNLFRLFEDIVERKYEVARSICFINFSPIQREIFAADFRDRIVHHLVFNYINPIFDKTFITDSYSCRKNKGTHYGIKRIIRFISQCSQNYTKDSYIMKLDIEGYFMNMDRELLYQKIITVLKEHKAEVNCNYEILTYLLQKIIFNDPTNNCKINGRKSDWNGLPKSKSLFCSAEGKGFPIGNLTSQLFGNIYLNELDHHIKDELKITYYGRYVDDIVLIHDNKNILLESRSKIHKFLNNRLILNLHAKKFYLQHFTKGVQFLGVYIKPYRIYTGKRCKTNFYKSIKLWNEKIESSRGQLANDDKLLFRANINSYLGLLKHYHTFRLRKKMMTQTLDKVFKKSFIFPTSYGKVIIRSE